MTGKDICSACKKAYLPRIFPTKKIYWGDLLSFII